MVERDERGQLRSGSVARPPRASASSVGSLPPATSHLGGLLALVNEFGGRVTMVSEPAQALLGRYSLAMRTRAGFEISNEEQPLRDEIHRAIGLLLPARLSAADYYRPAAPQREPGDAFRTRIQELGLVQGAQVTVTVLGKSSRATLVRVSFDSGNAALRIGDVSKTVKVWDLMRDGKPYMTQAEWEQFRGPQRL